MSEPTGVTREPDPDGPDPDFGALVAAELPGLYRYALSLVGDRGKAEDAVGDTMVRALEHRDQFRSQSSVRTWLHQILHHVAVDRARHDRHEVSVREVETLWRDDAYSVDAAAVAERAAVRDDLRESLLHLPFNYRAVVVLHDAEGWTVNDIAVSLGIGLAAAKQRLRRGRAMLVSILAERKEREMANRGVALTCWQARSRVSDYLDDELSPSERSLLEAHMTACATCPPLYGALVGVRESLGQLHDSDSVIPPELALRVQAKIEGVVGR